MRHHGRLFALTIAAALAGGMTMPASAADFYDGKQIKLIVGTPPSGAYDSYTRIIAPFWAEKIPGHPVIVVQNMGGSGGLQAANYMFNVAEKDGTVIGAMENNIPTAPILLPENAKFDAAQFGWIGSITSDPFIGFVWHESKMQTFEQAKTQQFIMGAPAARSFSAQMPSIANELFGAKFKLVIGYGGSDAVKLAMERGEIDGTFGNAYSSLKVQAPTWITEKKARIVMQFGLKAHPDLPDVPLFINQAKTESDKEMLKLLLSPQEFARTYLVPPGVPAERLAILRRAFDATVKEPKFLETMKKANLEVVNPLTGEELQPLVAEVAKTPPAVVQRTKEILDRVSAGPSK